MRAFNLQLKPSRALRCSLHSRDVSQGNSVWAGPQALGPATPDVPSQLPAPRLSDLGTFPSLYS